MNITPQISSAPIPTVVNPQTDSLRRENIQRDVITQPTAASKSAAEKGVASDKDKAKTPAQNNEFIDFANIKKQAEADNSTISDQSGSENREQQQDDQNRQARDENREQEQEAAQEFVEQQEIKQLVQRDREVRTHEQAHAAVGGPHTGAPQYTFTVGPDGKKYATDGEVSVDLSTIPGDPQATITKMQKVYAAALAPADPSVQDTRVAAKASRIIVQAKSELLAEKLDDPSLVKEQNVVSNGRSTFEQLGSEQDDAKDIDDNASLAQSNKFDNFINETLNSQEEIAPSRSEEVDARAGRIENFYREITVAYNKAPNSHFELTA